MNVHPKPLNVTTFFFSHFPHTFGEKEMWRIFMRWGRVNEVFISKKVKRWGHKFGFVRFLTLKMREGWSMSLTLSELAR